MSIGIIIFVVHNYLISQFYKNFSNNIWVEVNYSKHLCQALLRCIQTYSSNCFKTLEQNGFVTSSEFLRLFRADLEFVEIKNCE